MVTLQFIQTRHSRPRIGCRYRKCHATFSRKTDATRHELQTHQPTKLYCKILGCRFRGTVRQEVMRKHLKTKHPYEVESIFQFNEPFSEYGFPAAESSLEACPRASPSYQIENSSSSNTVNDPKTMQKNKANIIEQHPLGSYYVEMVGVGDSVGQPNTLSGMQVIRSGSSGLSTLHVVGDNQESLDQIPCFTL